jgi:hypothetical protein
MAAGACLLAPMRSRCPASADMEKCPDCVIREQRREARRAARAWQLAAGRDGRLAIPARRAGRAGVACVRAAPHGRRRGAGLRRGAAWPACNLRAIDNATRRGMESPGRITCYCKFQALRRRLSARPAFAVRLAGLAAVAYREAARWVIFAATTPQSRNKFRQSRAEL